jgi:hypothetical protein
MILGFCGKRHVRVWPRTGGKETEPPQVGILEKNQTFTLDTQPFHCTGRK